MAQGIGFKGNNHVFGKPQEWTDEQCYSLPVQVGTVNIDAAGHRSPVVVSCWRLTPNELAKAIQSGGDVYLTIHGYGMPPVSISADKPDVKDFDPR